MPTWLLRYEDTNQPWPPFSEDLRETSTMDPVRRLDLDRCYLHLINEMSACTDTWGLFFRCENQTSPTATPVIICLSCCSWLPTRLQADTWIRTYFYCREKESRGLDPFSTLDSSTLKAHLQAFVLNKYLQKHAALSASTIRMELSGFWGLPLKHSKPILSWRTLSLQTVFYYRLILWLISLLFLVQSNLCHTEWLLGQIWALHECILRVTGGKKGLNNGPCGIPKPFWKSSLMVR